MKWPPNQSAALALVACGICFGTPLARAAEPTQFKFVFGATNAPAGCIGVTPAAVYSQQAGYGFDPGSPVTLVPAGEGESGAAHGGCCTSERPFFFSVAVPEGNYRVMVTFGDPARATTNTVKAESRRLMLENVVTAPGAFVTRTFTVNVRSPLIADGRRVKLKPRESGPPPVLDWDDKLTLEFNGARPGVAALDIAKADGAVTVFLAGDSTVTDQPLEPWNSWGQMLPRFFGPGVAIANHAESGESLKSFLGANRLEKILSVMKPGDYLFIQFGHNDQKDRAPGAGAFTTYRTNLLRFVAEARKHGGLPVVVTSMERKAGVATETLGDFPAAARQVARDQRVPLIDLNAASRQLYAALGEHLGTAFQDDTHHNNYGSYELARCVVEGIKTRHLGLAKFIADDVPAFDPSRPDPLESFSIPASPQSSLQKPEGN
jgi:lysophospholipase L1-like esterase